MTSSGNATYRIGVDLGGTGIKAGIVNGDYQILRKAGCKTDPSRPAGQVIRDMAELIGGLLAEQSLTPADCGGIGVGSPGMIDHHGGVVVFAANLYWENVRLAEELGSYFDLPVRLANDANCAVYGETVAGAAKGCRDVVMLTLGTGIGGGVVCDMKLQEGGSAGGMELGHTLLVMDGEPCTCGRRGCVEAYASATALIRDATRAARAHPESLLAELCRENGEMNGIVPFAAMKRGCPAAKEVVDNYIHYLGEAIVDCVNIWRPQVVLLGGGLSHEGDPLIVPLNEYIRTRCFAEERGAVPEVRAALLGNDAGLVGAALL